MGSAEQPRRWQRLLSGASRFSTNARGLRGDEWSSGDSYRILAIGGSTTESLYLDDREAWPRLLQDRLNAARGGSEVWVGNAGKSGLSSRHHVIQVMRLLEQHPVDAVVVLAGVNDFHNRLSRDAAFLPIDQEPKREFRRLYLTAFSMWPARPAPIWEPVALQRRWARAHQRLERPEHVTQDDAGLPSAPCPGSASAHPRKIVLCATQNRNPCSVERVIAASARSWAACPSRRN